jgi:hypothetical protein
LLASNSQGIAVEGAYDVARQPIATILDHKMDAWLYTGTEWRIHNEKAPRVAREQWTVKFPPKVVARGRDYR